VRFVVDAQLPPALARAVSDAGYSWEHVADVGLLAADDEPIWQYASSHGSVIVTKDEDFSNRKPLRRGGPAVLWLRVGNCSNRALLTWFLPLLPQIIDRLNQGEQFNRGRVANRIPVIGRCPRENRLASLTVNIRACRWCLGRTFCPYTHGALNHAP
jgi:predicted nuclease of predicted toxin-antitoxin system